jgi:hypothetical protein
VGSAPGEVRLDAGGQHLGLLDPIFAIDALAPHPERQGDAVEIAARPTGDSIVAANAELIERGLGGSIDGANALEVLCRRIVGLSRGGRARGGGGHRLRA